MSNQFTDLTQADAIGNRLYIIKDDSTCIECNRPLKNKTAYLNLDNTFRCYDESKDTLALESVICLTLSTVKDVLKPRKVKLNKLTTKKIDKAIRDQLE